MAIRRVAASKRGSSGLGRRLPDIRRGSQRQRYRPLSVSLRLRLRPSRFAGRSLWGRKRLIAAAASSRLAKPSRVLSMNSRMRSSPAKFIFGVTSTRMRALASCAALLPSDYRSYRGAGRNLRQKRQERHPRGRGPWGALDRGKAAHGLPQRHEHHSYYRASKVTSATSARDTRAFRGRDSGEGPGERCSASRDRRIAYPFVMESASA